MKKILSIFVAVLLCGQIAAQKKIYIPKDLQSMDLNNPESKWSYARMDTTRNFVIFWEKGFGKDLANPPQLDGHPMKVNLKNLEDRLECFYTYYIDRLRFTKPGSNAEKYRMMVMLNYSLEGTAYGGDYDGVIGALWIAPNRVQDSTLNCIAHELGHCFQSQISCDGQGEAWGGNGIFEMASQWMLWQVNPNWVHDEQYHFDAFRKLTYKAFLHLDNIYHSPYVLEYWSYTHGLPFIAQLFREGKTGEDPVATYKRMNNMSQKDFCDDIFRAYMRLVNFDYPRVWKETRPYACTFTTKMDDKGDGWYQVAADNVPENYGFNVIQLTVPQQGTEVKVKFCGMTDGKENVKAGWRYAFVAVDGEGKSVYGKVYETNKGTASFRMPKDKEIKSLNLVVMGAPDKEKDAQWPYKIKLIHTTLK